MDLLSNIDRSGGPDACWPWMGPRDKEGYGRFAVSRARGPSLAPRGPGGRPAKNAKPPKSVALLVTRVVLHAAGVRIDGLCALHTCDNPPCCNPAHLFAGTKADNIADMDRKGRRVTTPKLVHRVLTDQHVREIRVSTVGAVSLARKYGVDRGVIWKVRTGKTFVGVV